MLVGEADALLRREKWAPAIELLRSREAKIAAQAGGRGAWLARLAVAEAGEGRSDEALWHWAAANSLDSGLFSGGELRSFGAAGALLAGHPPRQPGEAPAGVALQPPGPDVRGVARKEGEMPVLGHGTWAPREWLRLEIVVDEQGRPRDPVVLSACCAESAYQALEAVRGWRFAPATRNGAPVAVLHVVEMNPPGRLPIARIIALSAETEAIEDLLRRQRWQEAAEQAERRWYGLLDSTAPGGGPEAERAALGTAMAFQALAMAGLGAGDQATARCRWEAAESLMPSLYDLDLSPYGPAGATVAAWRQAAFSGRFARASARPGEEDQAHPVTAPKKIRDAYGSPYYPKAARKRRLEGRVMLASILDTEGRVRQPRLLKPLAADGQVLFAASALEAVCNWRFQPATLDARPVQVYYSLTVNFAIHGQ